MMLIDFILNTKTPTNSDDSISGASTGVSVVSGPGKTVLGDFPKALDFGANGKISAVVPPDQVRTDRFCIRLVFKIDVAVKRRMNLAESNCLPFSMYLAPASEGATSDFQLQVMVNPTAAGWSGATTDFFVEMQSGLWYTADLVFDNDTVGLFIDGKIVSLRAFPQGAIQKMAGNKLFLGTWTDGVRDHFDGKMAAFEWYSGEIPLELEAQLDERRSHPEWFLTYKHEQIKKNLNFGKRLGKYLYHTPSRAYHQNFETGLIMFAPEIGTAFEMHGVILGCYRNLGSKQARLGYLISDEGNAGKPGSRKNIFKKGGIYWSAQTGAVPVTGQIYLDYENLGEAKNFGLPISPATDVPGGTMQAFQTATLFHKNGQPAAFEVHGAILTKFLALGGVAKWGFPVSNECDVKKGNVVLGKSGEFEQCTIYWSAATGAHEIHGDIREKYGDLGGPLSELGFPTSDETEIAGVAGPGQYNTFPKGSILWFGNRNSMFVCTSFKIFLGTINTSEEEGPFAGENDLTIKVKLENNGHLLHSKDYSTGDKNSISINEELLPLINPNSPDCKIDMEIRITERDDWTSGNDYIGTFSKTLSMANAWGLRDNSSGLFESGKVEGIKNFTWSVKRKVDISTLTDVQKWWGVDNPGTPSLSYQKYALAFRDVDSETEWWDIEDWLEKAFYELFIESLSAKGNCFGMSLEGIYAWKNRSRMAMPLDQYKKWAELETDFNVKHQYQVGADAIWWFVGQYLSGNTHDPVDVFNETQRAFLRGDHPVVCIAQNWDFSGSPHALMPFAWDKSAKPWKLSIYDPNYPGKIKTIEVNPDANEFKYQPKTDKIYKGGAWSGGRFYYMPYCVLDERPRTPIWEAILLLLGGAVVILGSDAETTGLTDEQGNDLNVFGNQATQRLKNRQSLDRHFVPFRGFNAGRDGSLASDMFLKFGERSSAEPVVFGGAAPLEVFAPKALTLNDLSGDDKLKKQFDGLLNNPKIFNALKDRSLVYALNDKKFMNGLDATAAAQLRDLLKAGPATDNFLHRIRGLKNGQFRYVGKNPMSAFGLQSGIQTGEESTVKISDFGTSNNVVSLTTHKDKTVRLDVSNKLGAGQDYIKISIDKIPADSGKELNFNLRPGLGGLDLLTTGKRIDAGVVVETKIDGKLRKQNFGVSIEGGLRLHPSTALSDNELRVGKIETLFGQMTGSLQVKGQ